MKRINLIGHPIVFITLYLLLMIEGKEHFASIYLVFVYNALKEGFLYAILAAVGLSLVFTGYNIYRKNLHPLKPVLYLAGMLLMILSLFVFFRDGYKSGTFEYFMPVLLFILFSISGVFFLWSTISILIRFLQGGNA